MKKAFYHSIFISLFGVTLNLGFKAFLANLMPKETLALYFTSIDILTLTLLVLVGFRSSMVVSFMQTKNDASIINIFRIIILIAILLAWGFVIPFLKHKVGVHIDYWYLVATVIALGTGIYLSNQIAMYRLYSVINKVSFIEPVTLILWFVIAYYLAKTKDLQSLFIATVMSSLSVSLFIYLSRKNRVSSVPLLKVKMTPDMKKFLKNSFISTIEFASGMMLMYIAVILMMRYFSLNELGDFQVVTKPIFLYMITLFVFPIFRFVLPELSKNIAEKNIAEVIEIKRWVIKYAFIVSGVFLALSLLFSNEIITFLFSARYVGASLMLIHLAFFFVFVILNAYQLSLIKASGDFMSALYVRLIGLVSIVGMFYAIYYVYEKSVIAIIVSLVGSYTVMFLISLYFERKIMRELKKI